MAVAVRLAHKMGLDNEKPSFKVSFFEKEMRIRLWWQIRCLDGRARYASGDTIPPVEDGRMPLNLNDSELHPNMANCPVEHVGATEMIYCLLKYEGARWRQIAQTTKKPPSVNPPSVQVMIPKYQAIVDLERAFEEKYLRFCDTRIPLHFLSLTMSRLAICRLRFWACHPRGRADGGVRMTPEETDVMFEQSVQLLELDHESHKTNFSSQLLTHMAHGQLDALIYMLYELRQRPRGDRVIAAWNLVALFYDKHQELIDDTEKSLFGGLGDLTLEAWQVRWKELIDTHGGRADDITPWYIKELQARRPKESMPASSASNNAVAEAPTSELADPTTRLQLGIETTSQLGGQVESEALFLGMSENFGDGNTYDMGYWDDFLQM